MCNEGENVNRIVCPFPSSPSEDIYNVGTNGPQVGTSVSPELPVQELLGHDPAHIS